jgi:outer membrane protein assembly factor BamB
MPGYDIGRTNFNPETPQNTAGVISAAQVNSIHIEPDFPANIPGVTGSPYGQSVPVVAGGYIYLNGIDGVLHVMNAATGVQAWSAQVTGVASKGSIPPVVAGSQVFVTAGSTLYVYSTVTQRLQWSRALTSTNSFGPLVIGNDVFVASGKVLDHFSTSGAVLFSITAPNRISELPVANATTIFTQDAQAGTPGTDYVRAWSLASGALLWTKQHVADYDLDGLSVSGNVLVVSVYGLWTHAFDTRNGDLLWAAKDAANVAIQPGGTGLAVANGSVYVSGSETPTDPLHLYRFDLTSGHLIKGAASNPVPSNMTVDNGLIYDGSSLSIYDATTLKILWTPAQVVTAGFFRAPVVANGRFYAFNSNDQLVAYGL